MATVSGTVKDKDGNFAARMVRAYRRSDGALAGQIVSNATTGAYSITTLDGTEHFAIVHDGVVTAGDPYWNNVVLAMHMDGANNGTTFTDSSSTGKVFAAVGNVATSTTQYKYGTASLRFDGSFSKLTCSNWAAIGTADVTVEFWYNPGIIDVQVLVDLRAADNTSGFAIDLGNSASGKIDVWQTSARIVGTTTLVVGTWYHIAVVRASGVLYLYINGTREGGSYANAFDYTSTALTVGNYTGSANNTANAQGYIDDLRITNGVARYTENFTPPTSAFLNGPSLGSPTENALILDNITPL